MTTSGILMPFDAKVTKLTALSHHDTLPELCMIASLAEDSEREMLCI